ncbi:hypothetical protein BH10ACI1_BH10ACI1_32710 [soil metagenome]
MNPENWQQIKSIFDDAMKLAPYDFALVYMKLGNRDQTFFYLNKAFEDRSENLDFIRNMRDFDPIRNDALYTELMRKIGFE